MIKYAIFDVGQVCYPYSLNPLNNLMKEKTLDVELFMEKRGIKSFDYRPYMRGEISFSEFCQRLCIHSGVVYSQELEHFINIAMHNGVGSFYPETLTAIEKLKKRKIDVCLLSNALPNLSDTAAQLTLADNIFTSYNLGLLKPDIKIYQQVLKKLKANPNEILFIDDKPQNVKAAQTLGIYGIIFNRTSILKDISEAINNAAQKSDAAIKYFVDTRG